MPVPMYWPTTRPVEKKARNLLRGRRQALGKDAVIAKAGGLLRHGSWPDEAEVPCQPDTAIVTVPGQIRIALIAKLTLYGFEGGEGPFAEFPSILEKQGATRLGRSARLLPSACIAPARPHPSFPS